MRKNPTPQILALLTGIIIGLIALISGLLLIDKWIWAVTNALIVFIFTYCVSNYVIDFFIYRKIKVVYKNIHHLKSTKAHKNKVLQFEDPISGVNTEVVEWARDKALEIEQLKKNEVFRKEFLGNVSHELKTPLFAIQGFIETVIDMEVPDQDLTKHFLEKALLNAERLSNLITDLESISQLESGQLTMSTEVFDIHDMTQDIMDALEFKAREKSILLQFKEGSDVPTFVEADKNRIRQVMINLLENSIKYGNQKGTTKVGFYDMDENILIEIADNGIGVEPEHVSRLFERFYRVDKSRSRTEGGTGLGLSIVKHIIEAHQQTINVRSTVGVGTTFGFTLTKA
jgi:two-component system, OmpR family, phosphate regulon sensor histidine kinase PhoR